MTMSNYDAIIQANLQAAFEPGKIELAERLGAASAADTLAFRAFGMACCIDGASVRLKGEIDRGPRGVIISLLARHARRENGIEKPWRAFRELPDSMPYVGAFRARTEMPLVPRVAALVAAAAKMAARLGGVVAAQPVSGDCGLVLEPLPKIKLCYLLYRPDEDFPANATCLFSANADRFLPTDALADVGEYTTRAMIDALARGLR
jgi:hypothetical protein